MEPTKNTEKEIEDIENIDRLYVNNLKAKLSMLKANENYLYKDKPEIIQNKT